MLPALALVFLQSQPVFERSLGQGDLEPEFEYDEDTDGNAKGERQRFQPAVLQSLIDER